MGDVKNIVEIRVKLFEVWVFYDLVNEPMKLNKQQLTDEQKQEIQTFVNHIAE